MLELIDEVEMKVRHFKRTCWDITIELLADHLGIMDNPWKYSMPNRKWDKPKAKFSSYVTPALLKHIQDTNLLEEYVVAARANPWDHLGEIFEEYEMAGRKNRLGQCLTPRHLIDFMVKTTLGEKLSQNKPYSYTKPDLATLVWQTVEALEYNDKLAQININLQAERARWHTVIGMTPLLLKYEQKPITDLDPATGTGRFLIAATLMYPKMPLILYGIEIDVSLYRACLVNMALFSNHRYSIVRANTLMLDPRVDGPNCSLWDTGNQWDPPNPEPFYCHPEPKISSLQRFIRMNPDLERKPLQPKEPMLTPLQSYVKWKKQQP